MQMQSIPINIEKNTNEICMENINPYEKKLSATLTSAMYPTVPVM